MLTLIQEAGFPIWFVLAFGALTLLCCARYAATPRPDRLPLAGALALATLFSTVTAIAADLATVGHQGSAFLAAHPGTPLHELLLQGGAESLSPAIIGFSMLTLAALLCALGCYRALEVV
ncbi:MAG: hypothetical protein ABJB12_10640 [Pseudomonadota bacterium]